MHHNSYNPMKMANPNSAKLCGCSKFTHTANPHEFNHYPLKSSPNISSKREGDNRQAIEIKEINIMSSNALDERTSEMRILQVCRYAGACETM
ncbi:hypothetical protein PSSHI_14860 [Photobacterium sp. R1]